MTSGQDLAKEIILNILERSSNITREALKERTNEIFKNSSKEHSDISDKMFQRALSYLRTEEEITEGENGLIRLCSSLSKIKRVIRELGGDIEIPALMKGDVGIFYGVPENIEKGSIYICTRLNQRALHFKIKDDIVPFSLHISRTAPFEREFVTKKIEEKFGHKRIIQLNVPEAKVSSIKIDTEAHEVVQFGHILIRFQETMMSIEDLNSTNGTFVTKYDHNEVETILSNILNQSGLNTVSSSWEENTINCRVQKITKGDFKYPVLIQLSKLGLPLVILK